jgi:hypothetical protein
MFISQPGVHEKWVGGTQKSNLNEHFWFGGTRIPIRGWKHWIFFIFWIFVSGQYCCFICGTCRRSETDVTVNCLDYFFHFCFRWTLRSDRWDLWTKWSKRLRWTATSDSSGPTNDFSTTTPGQFYFDNS